MIKNNNPLVSVIVPIYKIDRYLGLCIESIINQTYKNLEIILVDDGSPDRCPEICDLYATKDSRIKVIHKTNGGLVSARKAGLAVSTGQYVGYVDGDDWIESNYYEKMIMAIQESDSDIVISGQSRDLFTTSSHIRSNIPSGKYEGNNLRLLKQNMMSYGDFFRIGITTYVWNKLFKQDLLFKHQNSVDNLITIGEDAAVTYPYLMECDSVCIIDDCGYHYRQREDSMLKKNSSFSKEAVGLKILCNHLKECSEPYSSEYEYSRQIEDFVLGICIMRSGGVIKEIQDGHTPYSKDFFGKNIVIWSAGTFGQQLCSRIKERNYCNIVGWIDADYQEYRRCCLNVDPIDAIINMKYDYVLLATVNGYMADSIKSMLVWKGVDEEKILTVECPQNIRKSLLQRYLNVSE